MSTNKYLNKLAKTRVFVLGGTSGIGFSVAEASVEYGAYVTIASSNQEKINKTITQLQQSYPQYKDNINGVVCDISDVNTLEANLQAALEYAAGDNGNSKIDHIVFTATPGVSRLPLNELTVESIRPIGDARFIASLLLAKHAVKYMNPSATSSLTLTGGVATDRPYPGVPVLAGYGSGLEGIARGLAVDMKPIRVNVVSPGMIDTPLLRGNENFAMFEERAKTGTLMGFIAKPEDTAEAYLYLMKDRYVTGQKISTEGGYLLC